MEVAKIQSSKVPFYKCESNQQGHMSNLHDVSGDCHHHLKFNKERIMCVSLPNYKALQHLISTSKAEILIIMVINGSKTSFQIYSSHIR